ncbi:MAG: DoxX family protein [Bacteroidetes bacterium]|nr:DoxX family protein [Bacteroidota bacterium]
MKKALNYFINSCNNLQSIALLGIRLILAYNFYTTAIVKWEDINSVVEWFTSMNIIFPKANAYFVASIEMIAVFAFILGIGTRIVSIILMPVLAVAIYTVHFQNGYSVGNNGYEIPLYYILMLTILLSFGSGKLSLDNFLKIK